jgi:hypothetical protein
MLSIFTVPKPFQGHIGMIQRNALQSWLRLPGAEVILCGDEEGVEESAALAGARHLPEIAANELGTPLIGSAFEQARHRARNRFLCYVNADVILLSDLLEATALVAARMPAFLIAGQRWNLDVRHRLDFASPGWESRLRAEVGRSGDRQPPWGSDYFVFPRGLELGPFPSFAIGRPRWDNWLIYRARCRRIPIVDASRRATVVHQQHDYDHIPRRSGRSRLGGDLRWEGPEAKANRALARQTMGSKVVFHLHDATHVLGKRRPWPAIAPRRLLRRWQVGRALSRQAAG